MSIKIGLACLFILVAATATKLQTNSIESQYVPIPKRFPGILIGDGNAPITLELVYDPTCIFKLIKAMEAQTLTRPSKSLPKDLTKTP